MNTTRRSSWLGLGFAGLMVPAAAQTFDYEQELLSTMEGNAPEDRMGVLMASAFDVDGDGLQEVLVTADQWLTGGPGEVYLVSGAAVIAGNPAGGILKTWTGDAAGDGLRIPVCVGDMDLDGYPEIALGAPQTNGSKEGYVKVYSGGFLVNGQGPELLATLTGQPGDEFGYSVAGGDTDNDGRADLVVGAIQQTTGTGYAQVLSGLNIATGQGPLVLHQFNGFLTADVWGAQVAVVGDLDQDGCQDVGVSSSWVGVQDNGRVELYSGRTGALLKTLGGIFRNYGTRLEGLGDVNADGIPDVGVGSYPYTDGYVRVYSGKDLVAGIETTLHVFVGATGDQQYELTGLGDLDGDGADDFAIGAYQTANGGAGYVRVISGATGAEIDRHDGENLGDAFGTPFDLGDVDGNGRRDLGVCAYRHDGNTGNPNDDRGKAYFYRGRCVGTATPYGSGVAGSGGFTPGLGSGSEPRVGGVWNMQLRDGLGGSLALLLTGLNQDALPAFGGTLHVKFDSTFRIFPCALPGSLPGEGDRDIPFNLPDTGLLDCVFGYAQVLVYDPVAPSSWAMSPGLAVVVGE